MTTPRLDLVALWLALSMCCAHAQATSPPAPAVSVDWSKAVVVTVRLTEYEFVPDHLSFRHGVPYRLRLENDGAEIHDFTAPAFFATVTFADPHALGAYGTSILIKPHERKDIDFTANRPGSYPLTCADHDWAGMAGMIMVE